MEEPTLKQIFLLRQTCAWSPLTGRWHVQSRNLLTVPLLAPMKDCLGLWETRGKCAAAVLGPPVPCGLKCVSELRSPVSSPWWEQGKGAARSQLPLQQCQEEAA